MYINNENTDNTIFPAIATGGNQISPYGGPMTGMTNYSLGNGVTSYQTDIWSAMNGKLQYEFLKREMALAQQQTNLYQRYEYGKALKDLQIQHEAYLQAMGITVYRDSLGDIIFAITDSKGGNIISTVLLNVKNYKTCMYTSYYPEFKTVLSISWGNGNDKRLRFDRTKENFTPELFLKKLKTRGIFLQVSGRTEKKAATALLAYSINSATDIIIPFSHGWGKDSEGRWHYAMKDELTMKEVLKDAE